MNKDQITLAIGIVGAVLILIPFLMNQVNRWKNDSLLFDLFNFLGSVILIAYGILSKAYPFLILNSIWAIFSLKDLIFKKRGR